MLEFDDSGLKTRLAQFGRASNRIEERINGRTVQAIRALLKIARGDVHVQSGHLRDSLYIDGPFPIAEGTLEARVKSPVSYAEEEASRPGVGPDGEPHNYPQRTLDDGAEILDQLARDLEKIVIQEMGAGAS